MERQQKKLTTFGSYIGRVRRGKEIEQRFVAETLGYTQSYISQIEAGEIVNLTEDLLRNIAKTLNISYDEIMTKFIADKYNWKPSSDWTNRQDRIRKALVKVQEELEGSD